MKALSLALLMLLYIPVKLYAVETDSSAKEHFYRAKEHIEDMLSGKTPLSYEQAIFEIENAWHGGTLSQTTFNNALNYHVGNINSLVRGWTNPLGQDTQGNLLETQEQKRFKYQKALTNFAIFQYMTDMSLWIQPNGVLLHKPYTYSYSDPLGTAQWTNTHVTSLLNTHKGNCFALSSLFKIFSDRLQSDAILCTAPGHIYIRHSDDKGTFFNVELASKSFPGTGTLETITHSPTDAVKNNIALRELTTKQAVALCLVYLAKGYEYKFGIKQDDFMLMCAETSLQFDNRNLNAMLLKAEILEQQLLKESTELAKVRAHNGFKEYEQLVSHIYHLGYREMPFEMKNLLINGWMKDTTIQINTTDNTPTQFQHSSIKNTRYASLSWGLFDEEIRTKPLERYGNTIFDTKRNAVVGFVENDILYNQYNFDPVVFAWNVDPMAHKFPHASPYCFVENNPIIRVDPDGNEWVNAFDAKVAYWTGELNKNPDSRQVKRQLKFAQEGQAKVNGMLTSIRTNDRALYDYIDNLKITDNKGNNQNVKVFVRYEDGSGPVGEYGRTEGLRTSVGNRAASYVTPVTYNGNQISLPIQNPNSGKEVYGFDVTIYGGSYSEDNTLANEAGDVMYIMEYNAEKMSTGSDKPGRESYYKKGGSGDYSRTVESTYKSRKSQTQQGNPPTDNPYPLQK